MVAAVSPGLFRLQEQRGQSDPDSRKHEQAPEHAHSSRIPATCVRDRVRPGQKEEPLTHHEAGEDSPANFPYVLGHEREMTSAGCPIRVNCSQTVAVRMGSMRLIT